jgi:predicted naringenin-chalcone synthase
MIVTPSAPGLRVVDIAARTDSVHQDAMSWHVTDLGFRMGLSPRVPAVLLEHVKPMVDDLLRRHDLVLADIDGWAIHPGGPRILDVCADALHLSDDQMQASRNTLRDHGNCSSATVALRRALAGLLARHRLTRGRRHWPAATRWR